MEIHSFSKKPSLSFCMITNGVDPGKLRLAIQSIKNQPIESKEILLVGNCADPGQDVVYIPVPDAAASGRLGAMRNLGVAQARYENIVILDDDMILTPHWSEEFAKLGGAFDIMTSRVRLPDGTRYWDHASFFGPAGHRLLDSNAEVDSSHLYMSGGTAWVMKDYVARSVRWSDSLGFYQSEDIDFSAKCHAKGYGVVHRSPCVAYHFAPKYSRFGRIVLVRSEGRSNLWLSESPALSNPESLFSMIREKALLNQLCETADCLRAGMERFPLDRRFELMWTSRPEVTQGEIDGDRWYLDGDPYFRYLLDQLGLGKSFPCIHADLGRADDDLHALLEAAERSAEDLARCLRNGLRTQSSVLRDLAGVYLEDARNANRAPLLGVLGELYDLLNRMWVQNRFQSPSSAV